MTCSGPTRPASPCRAGWRKTAQRVPLLLVGTMRPVPQHDDMPPSSMREVFDVGGERGHLQGFDRPRRACGGNARRSLERRIVEVVQDRRPFAGIGAGRTCRGFPRRPSAASTGSRPSAIAPRSAALTGGGARRSRAGISRASGTGRSGLAGSSPSFLRISRRRGRIDRKPRPHRGARCIVDLIDQAGGKLDELPLFVAAVRVGLNIEIGQHAQQSGSDIDALATGECHQPVKARKKWRCGHVRVRD